MQGTEMDFSLFHHSIRPQAEISDSLIQMVIWQITSTQTNVN
jgi:hypothetical protein